MSLKITFLGAAGTVTGSKYLLEDGKTKILVDAGMFQGERGWRDKNWQEPTVKLSEISAVIVTHAHIDHIGMLPRFVRQGLKCPIYMTPASAALAALILRDSGRLQEEEAEYRGERGRSRHKPPLPLYTEADAIEVNKYIKQVQFHKEVEFLPGIKATWQRMGHIIGAGSIRLSMGGRIVNFSGDIGRYKVPILKDPENMDFGDLLLIESTYGDKVHPVDDIKTDLGLIIKSTAERGGVVVIPAFAVGRVQTLLFHIRELKKQNLIPDIPVIIDSPMGAEATTIYRSYPEDYDDFTKGLIQAGELPFSFPKLAFTKSRGESIKLNSIGEPMIIISASGMLTGGRILHHLKHRIADPRNTILFVGFQPPGSRGDWIKSGASSLRLLGEEISIRAQIAEISGLSAHADKEELLRWCKSCTGKPGKVAVVHGEPGSATMFSETLKKEFSWNVQVAKYLESWEV